MDIVASIPDSDGIFAEKIIIKRKFRIVDVYCVSSTVDSSDKSETK